MTRGSTPTKMEEEAFPLPFTSMPFHANGHEVQNQRTWILSSSRTSVAVSPNLQCAWTTIQK